MYRWSTQIGEIMPSRRTVLRNTKLDNKGRILKNKAPESAPVENVSEENPAAEKAPVADAPKKVAEVSKPAPSRKPEEKKAQSESSSGQKKSKK